MVQFFLFSVLFTSSGYLHNNKDSGHMISKNNSVKIITMQQKGLLHLGSKLNIVIVAAIDFIRSFIDHHLCFQIDPLALWHLRTDCVFKYLHFHGSNRIHCFRVDRS